MDLRIGEPAVHHLTPPGRISQTGAPDAAESGKRFAEFLNDAVAHVSAAEKAAQDIGAAFALGEPVEIHEVMLAFEKADLTMRLFLELRNKVIDAYQEIMRMPV
jgi:flagellar hook-basal body complex protein FliE